MAVISGFYAASSTHGYDRLYLTGDMDDYAADWIGDLASWLAALIPGASALVTHWPVEAAPKALAGFAGKSYFDDYYNRVHVIPAVVDIGNLLSVQTRDVGVWNAHLTSQALSAITESGTSGLTETGVTAPTTFTALEERTFSVTVDTNGPATISALYTFQFAQEAPTLAVTGNRVVVFGFAPNWRERVVESYEWLTDVIESYGGDEQRIGLRGAPRRGLRYSLSTMDKHASNRLETLLLGWQARLFALPVWTDAQALAADLPAGSLSVACATAGYEFAANGLAILWRAHDDYEAVEVAAVNAGGLDLVLPTLAAWPAGSKVLPVRLGRLPAAQKLDRVTDWHFIAEVDFAIDDHPGWTAADMGAIYLGYPVYPLRPNWAGGLDVEHARKLAELDYQTGKPWRKDESGLGALIKRWHWLHQDRAEITAFRGWLAARNGRQVPFWSETQGDDLTVTAPIAANDQTIQIRNIGYQRYLNGRSDRRHIALHTRAGATYYRQINGATEIDDTQEMLTIDAPLGALLNPADLSAVRFMHLMRLESDAIEIDWHHLSLAETTAAMRSLPA